LIVELTAAAALIGWRVFRAPVAELWRDWILVASVYWIFTALTRRSRIWPLGTLAGAGYLIGIYALRQVPHTIAVLGLLP
jgi:hypothetical protein